jgi:hypothetical protein
VCLTGQSSLNLATNPALGQQRRGVNRSGKRLAAVPRLASDRDKWAEV